MASRSSRDAIVRGGVNRDSARAGECMHNAEITFFARDIKYRTLCSPAYVVWVQ